MSGGGGVGGREGGVEGGDEGEGGVEGGGGSGRERAGGIEMINLNSVTFNKIPLHYQKIFEKIMFYFLCLFLFLKKKWEKKRKYF